MVNKNALNNPNSPFVWYSTTIEKRELDPSIAEYLPPELREILKKEIGENNSTNTEQEKTENKPVEKIKYDYKLVNCDQDLKSFVSKLKKAKKYNFGMLFYGAAGTGKSELGKFLAQELKMPFIKKRASDLIDKYIGQTERNIADAFKEARKKKAILLIDEADAFLMDRKFAQREFEVSSVTEMLTQMEDHPYPFIMTTNIKDKMDNAAMRRFIFKIKFEEMKEENVQAAVKFFFGKFKLTKEQLKALPNLTAGDFKVAKQKMDILEGEENYSNKLIYEYLLTEQKNKNLTKTSPKIEF